MAKYLQAELLKTAVAAKSDVDMDIVVHESIDSTNSWCLQQCKAGRVLPFACFAEEQISGRGRRGKQWLMSAHSNIAMSISWPFGLSYPQLHLLPLSIALAIVKTLESLNIKDVQIKWPNDVYVQGKKIAGILIETQPVKQKQLAVVIGVGLNYDMSSLKSLLGQDSAKILADLTDIDGEIEMQAIEQKPDRTIVASTLLQYAVDVCQNFQQDPKYYLEKFRSQYDYCKNKTVEIILDNQETMSGTALGVNDNAELIVMVDGKEQVFNSAEVSVKAEAQ